MLNECLLDWSSLSFSSLLLSLARSPLRSVSLLVIVDEDAIRGDPRKLPDILATPLRAGAPCPFLHFGRSRSAPSQQLSSDPSLSASGALTRPQPNPAPMHLKKI
ncbi:hypothetical protein BT93_L3148 [Corymbia citriodora subsp. variegata]|uniref:Uncharacterized protein n=1 Tax=Corymbia citriodora subsp. variegata TaxID=360336 RepID=A0A8T0CN59_CORYI|nr:hypothetical protein BT93_L3148 [Corymbia citriodora subsp. variegata]